MIALEKIQNLSDEISELEASIEELKVERNAAIVEARKDGETWQRIADDAGMTIQGVRNAAAKHHEEMAGQD